MILKLSSKYLSLIGLAILINEMAAVIGITELALIVKACDRLTNIRACVSDKNHEKIAIYKSEYPIFKNSIFREGI
jgi:hypothetical protein